LRLKIRLFQPEDLELLTEFWKEMTSDPIVSGDFYLCTNENVARRQKYIMKVYEEDQNQILVAEEDNEIVGYIVFLKRDEFPLETAYTWASINELYVQPAYRRRGIATKLIKQAFTYLSSIGVTHVRLNVTIENRAAINLYRKIGFKDLSLRMQLEL